MTDGLLFANAVAKAKENNLFSAERLGRLIECDTLADAVKILVEANYGGGVIPEDPADFEDALIAEEALADIFLHQLKLDEIGMDCFLISTDYHNVKAILKNIYGNAELSPMLEGGGYYDSSWLKERIGAEEPNINPYIDTAVKEIKKAFEIKKSPRLIDTLVDKAMFQDIAERLKKKSADALIKRYFAALADLTNIDSMLRAHAIGADFNFFEASFAEGGLLSLDAFHAIFVDAWDKLPELVKGTPYPPITAKIAEGGLPRFASARDDFLLDIFREGKNEMFSAAPVAGYFLAKKQEVKMLRIALVCIKNGVGKAEIRKRMRSMYA